MGYCSQDAGEISGSLLGKRSGRGTVSKCSVSVLSPVAAGLIGVQKQYILIKTLIFNFFHGIDSLGETSFSTNLL